MRQQAGQPKMGEGTRAMSLAYISCFPERPHGSLPFL